MYTSLRHRVQKIHKGRKSAVVGFSDAFRSISALEEHDSSQIDPCAAGKGPQFMLPLASVAGLVVPGVEAELEV